jgi:P4 family phage/plasmid primase-like protien
MTEETTTYTDSALCDNVKNFFNRYKVDDSYKYVSMIDTRIIQGQVVEIDFNDFTDEVKEMLDVQPKDRIHTSIYRAISEVFQVRRGTAELEQLKQQDILKFRLSNCNIFDDTVCSNPKLIHYEDYDKTKFEGDEKITNVAIHLQRNNQFVTLRKTEEVLLYDGKIYDNLQAKTIIKEETEKLIPNCTEHCRNESISKIKAQTYTDLEDFDSDTNLITVPNGILALDTQTLTDHTHTYLSRVLIPTEYHTPEYEIHDETIFDDIEKNLKDTLFWKFLTASFTINGKFKKDNFESALEVSACAIVKHQIDEKAIMFLGNGDNGKSVLFEYVENMIGEKNVSNIPLQKIADDKFMSADLDGMSANIFTDLGHNELRHAGEIKAIISGEGIQVQKKHGHPFKLKPFCKLMFSSNRFPKVFDQSQGFFRRWIIIKWERNFDGDPQRDEGLKQKLRDNADEKSKVFSCLVKLADKLNRLGKFTHTQDWKTIQKEWNENADPLDGFATNYIMDSEDNQTKRDTYRFYKEIMFEKGETPLGIGQFGKQFSEYYEEDRDNKTRVWLNIDFKRPVQTTFN